MAIRHDKSQLTGRSTRAGPSRPHPRHCTSSPLSEYAPTVFCRWWIPRDYESSYTGFMEPVARFSLREQGRRHAATIATVAMLALGGILLFGCFHWRMIHNAAELNYFAW